MTNASWATDARTRSVMIGNRSRDTRPELELRRALHAMGLRFRVAYRPEAELRRTADIVFPRARVAVFVDGCYWHGCPEHYVPSMTNQEYWNAKIAANRQRDTNTTSILAKRGWKVLRFWSHEPTTEIAQIVRDVVKDRRRDLRHG